MTRGGHQVLRRAAGLCGTLFDLEDERQTLREIGVPPGDVEGFAPALARMDEMAGNPALMPAGLRPRWERCDDSVDLHRSTYLDFFRAVGLPPELVEPFYDRAISPEAWFPYADTAARLRELAARQIPVAVVSNIGWDPRPVFVRHGVLPYVGAFVIDGGQLGQDRDPGG